LPIADLKSLNSSTILAITLGSQLAIGDLKIGNG